MVDEYVEPSNCLASINEDKWPAGDSTPHDCTNGHGEVPDNAATDDPVGKICPIGDHIHHNEAIDLVHVM